MSYKSWLCSSPFRGNLALRGEQCAADIIHLDLEDSVPPHLKASARKDVVNQLGLPRDRKFALRINALSTLEGIRDVLLFADWDFRLDILVLPKIESAAEIRMVSKMMADTGRTLEIFAIIETLDGLHEVERIAGVGHGLRGLILGAADISLQLGIKVAGNGRAMDQIKYQIALATARHGLLAIDSPCFDINDAQALELELDVAKEYGFAGKVAIHPSQVAAINTAFSPSESELKEAHDVIRCIDESPHGIADMQGRMVGPPFAKIARHIIKKSQNPQSS